MSNRTSSNGVLAVAIYNGLLGFEFSCVAEMFGLVRPGLEDSWYDFRLCRVERGKLESSHGLAIQPKFGLNDIRNANTIVVPGWRDPTEKPKPAFLNALVAAYRNGARIVSVCTGAFVLAHAGLLNGKRATTHWLHADYFRKQFPKIELLDDAIYIHDGSISTSAGSSAGLDLCLSIIRSDYGVEVANMVARRMVAPGHREGGQSQYAEPEILDASDSEFGPVLDWIASNLSKPITLEQTAEQFDISLRTLHRRFNEITGLSPLAWISQQRINLARKLLETSDLSIEQIASKSGLGSAANLRKHFDRQLRLTPSVYRSTFKAVK